MKIKHQLAIFNALTRLLVIVILWVLLPFLVEKVLYKHINQSLLEKNKKFMEHLDNQEINDFIVRNDATETYASFSTLHNEFIKLSRLSKNYVPNNIVFTNESRIIEGEQEDFRISQHHFIYLNKHYLLEIGNSLSEVKDLTFIIRLFILIVLIVILVVTFLMDTFYIEYLLKPFYKIIDTKIRRVNEPDIFDHTPIASHSADFKELDTVLNQMMIRISELFKKEKQFIANVSHELLTPIALLKNKFENLLQNESLNDTAIDKISSSLQTLDVLKKVINSLLLISRIENNQYETNETINFNELLTNLSQDLEDRINDKQLIFSKKLQYQFQFKSNKTLINILLYNILVNALKYNRERGFIKITDGFLDQNYYLSIEDSGIGMTEAQLQKIFNRFIRINTDQEGQGLGLAIVDSIAHFCQIKIEVTSVLNEGTRFVLIFQKTEIHN